MSTPSGQLVMLRDAVRTLQYRAAIFAHARDQVVLDLGCGSGVLSIFAVQAGAKHVYAVERSDVAVLARLMFKANRVEDKVTLMRADSRTLDLPERAGLIMHEILGGDPLCEGLVPSIEDARKRFLAPGGRLLPSRIEICAMGLDALKLPLQAERLAAEIAHLGRLYGVDFSALDLALQTWDPSWEGSDAQSRAADHLLTDEVVLWDLDLSRPLTAQVEAAVTAKLRVRHPGRLAAALLYFRAHLDENHVLTTSPFAPRTHWDFTVHELQRVVAVAPGDEVALSAHVEPVDDSQRIVIALS